MQGQPVPAATRDDAEHLVSAHKSPGHFGNGSVSAYRHHDIGIAFPCKDRRMSRTFGKDGIIFIFAAVQMVPDQVQHPLLVLSA